ncbi:hypothetical protein QZH56_20965 [Streptomyces olivoreticuli]|uniref:hypothetical protein n=1 Tax=Streptomyces olivoreticuli TaxID=68246 RepID=UPI00265934EA|nr:hypothetical protein [Streptomyces olivoreticuli]WKK21334.1 hypothetical protein QZH56_20965 [Streptomyces olivoreticuli]
MPDDLFGDPHPPTERPLRKRRAREEDQRTIPQRITDCARFADLYTLTRVLEDARPRPRGGRRAHYPPYIYLVFLAVRGVFGSARGTAGHLQHPSVWHEIKKGVAEHLGNDEAARLPELGPSRNHWQHAQRTLLIPRLDGLNAAYQTLALRQALNQGLLPPGAPRSWSHPQRHQLLVGDGTVAKAPTLATAPYTVDETTGEIRRRRLDPAAWTQTEGGGTRVRGTKFIVFSARHTGYLRRVLISYRHVPHRHPGGEAAAATEAVTDLLGHPDAAGCLGLVYDGALRGTHRDTIQRRGRLLINKQHEGLTPIPLHTLDFPRCRHELWAVGGRVAERIWCEDGTSAFTPLPITRLQRRGEHTHRWYHQITIPCPHGPHHHREPVGITTTPGERAPGQSDLERKFHRAEHLVPIPPNTYTHDEIYSHRDDAESVFTQFDRHLWNGRLIAFGAEAQSLVMLGFLLAQNATSAARHQEDPTPQQP